MARRAPTDRDYERFWAARMAGEGTTGKDYCNAKNLTYARWSTGLADWKRRNGI